MPGISRPSINVLGGVSANLRSSGLLYRGAPATIGNVTTGETDLWSYTLPANALGANGDAIVVESGGFLANNGNTKTIRLYLGAQSAQVHSATTANVVWYVKMNLARLTSSSVRINGHMQAGSTMSAFDSTLTSLSFTVDNVVKITGQGTSSDDLSSKFMTVKFEGLAV